MGTSSCEFVAVYINAREPVSESLAGSVSRWCRQTCRMRMCRGLVGDPVRRIDRANVVVKHFVGAVLGHRQQGFLHCDVDQQDFTAF